LQRRELLLPHSDLFFRTFASVSIPSVAPSVREFDDFDRAWIVFRLAVIGESRKANPLHAYQQAVRSGRAAPKISPRRVSSFIAAIR